MIWIAISSIILYFISQANYLFFHAIVEGFAIIVAILIYVLGTRTYKHSRNNMFLFIGIAYLHIAILDFAHLLTYKGMGVFVGFDSDAPTQLWIAGRFMEAISFFILQLLGDRHMNKRFINGIYIIVNALILLSIMVFRVFPACFIEGQGLTTFKIISEYIIVAILFVSIYLMHLRREEMEQGIFKSVTLAMIITAISELSFTLYTDVYGISNMIGHLLKIASYYFVYQGLVVEGIDAPYSLMAEELKDRAIRDSLTGIYNRQGMVELVEKEMTKELDDIRGLGILMIDLDNFKLLNDKYGHLYGDKVLKKFAGLLKQNIRDKDIACRYGGDEFVVLACNIDQSGLSYLKERIQNAADLLAAEDERLKNMGISIGSSLLPGGQALDIDDLLKEADKSMYKVKERKKSLF